MNNPIGLIDSGVGGFTVLKELQAYFPNENFIYFGDSKNMPYGEKNNNEIIQLVNTGIELLENNGVKFIVLACNTASSLIDELDSEVKLFSIIEAGCLASLDHQRDGKIGLIATRATVNNQTYDKLLRTFSTDLTFISYGTQDLARVINDKLDEIKLLKENIQLAIEPILEQEKIEYLLLGCTHFPIVSQTIKELYPEIQLIDPAQKQALLVNEFMRNNNITNKTGKPGRTQILLSSDHNDKINRRLLNELNINYERLRYLK